MPRIKCFLCKKNHNIKPCPFCGSKAVEVSLIGFGYSVGCGICGATVKDQSSIGSHQIVIQAWNQRA